MAIELTREQEEVLLKIIQREIDAPTLLAAADAAKAALVEAEGRWAAEREATDLAANTAINAVNDAYKAEIEAKRAAVDAAKAAIATSALVDKAG